MVIKIIALAVCAAAALCTFKGEYILKKLKMDSEPSPKDVMTLKYIALGLAVAAFAAVFFIK